MKPVSLFHACIECDDVITEPICSSCLAQRMQMVVREHDPKLAKDILNCAVEEGESSCLFCGKKMNLCAHCFSREVYTFLQEKNPEVAEMFMGRFDFDLRRSFLSNC